MIVGKYSYGQPIVHWENNKGQLSIGNFTCIAGGVHVYLGGNHNTNWITTYPFGHVHHDVFTKFNGIGHPSTKGDVKIGSDVWIGDHVTIMSGVTISDGVVIANNSHVVKNAEAYTLIGGNPAKTIKHRFTKEQINALMQIKWWNWEDSKINEYSDILCSDNINTFINAVYKLK